MPTTNPVPSQDPSDLLFNAGKLDEVLNGTGNSFTDRLGVARRTVAGMNADFDAQLADAESDLNVYRADAAASAAQALGYLNTIRTTSYGAYASDPATDPLGNPPTVGDEYFNTVANLLKRWNGTTWQASDINTASLAAPSGSSLVGHDAGTVQDVLDAVTGPTGAASVGYTPAGVGAVATNIQEKIRDLPISPKGDFAAAGDGVADDTSALTKVAAAKKGSTTAFHIPVGTYKQTAQLSLTGYNFITGDGDQSQIKVTTGSSLAYVAQTGVWDDHPHNTFQNFRITGDGTLAIFPNPQNGTTTGLNFAVTPNIGNNATAENMTFELHDIGRYIKQSYGQNGAKNHYRANKIGLKLEGVTSFVESNSYFRNNSTAGVQIVGGQNVTIQGGAIEGNSGIGLQYVPGASSSWSQINIRDVYFELNGNIATGVPSIDIPFGSKTMVNIVGGSLWSNTASGVTSGHYRLGDNALLDGVTVSGRFDAKYARIRNIRGFMGMNTSPTEAGARVIGLIEPMILLEYSPSYEEYTELSYGFGPAFCTQLQGRGTDKIPGITNLANLTYPYGYSGSGGPTTTENTSLDYGEGSFVRFQFAATVGSFNSNYASLKTFTDTTKPYRVVCSLIYSEQDCEIGIIQSGGGQSASVYFALKANTYYRLVLRTSATMTGTSYTRIFPLNAEGPAINFHGVWASQHADHKEQLLVVSKLVDGDL